MTFWSPFSLFQYSHLWNEDKSNTICPWGFGNKIILTELPLQNQPPFFPLLPFCPLTVCLCGQECGGQRSTSNVVVLPRVTSTLFFEIEFLTRTWKLWIRLVWLPRETQRNTSFCLPSSRILSILHHAWLFTLVWLSNPGPHAGMASTLQTEPAPWATPFYIYTFTLWNISVTQNMLYTNKLLLNTCQTSEIMHANCVRKVPYS